MKKESLPLDKILFLVRIIVGLLFVFSGFVKINDPLGFSYKLEEYFEVFGMESLKFSALFLSLFFCGLEMLLGFGLLLGYKIRWIHWGLLGLILFFTFLTFYSAYFNKVTECGCFGDAIKLSPWQSFYKNLVLLVLILFLFLFTNRIKPLLSEPYISRSMMALTILVFSFGIYCFWFLPPIDFLPYKVGNYLPDQMEIPKGEQGDLYSVFYTLKNAKTGEIKTLDDKEYIRTKIYENKEWVYVKASEPVLVKAGYQAPAKDFKIFDTLGMEHTQELVQDPGFTLLVVEYDLKNSPSDYLPIINTLSTKLKRLGVKTLGLTSATKAEVSTLLSPFHLDFPFYTCDAVPLKSMVRSNPGLVLIKKGVILGKWPNHALPSAEELEKNFINKP